MARRKYTNDETTLAGIRSKAKLSQTEVIQRIRQMAGDKVPSTRKAIAEAEAKGTDSLTLLEGMATVYNRPLYLLIELNRAARYSSQNNVQKSAQNP